VVAGKVLVRCHIGARGRGVRCRSVAHPVGELQLRNSALPRGCGRHLASGCVALRVGACSPKSFHPRLTRALAGASSVSWCRGARSVRLGGCRGVSSRRGRNRSRVGRPPRVKLVAVGDAHEVAIPRGLKVQAPEPDFESSWEGVQAAHGVPLAPVLGADRHRDGLWKLIFSAQPLPSTPTVGAESSPDTN
jgi:hypothetical protein